jgi:dynein heavy chain
LTAPVQPKARELCSIVYDKNESRLIVFGGWNYNLLPDLYSLNVSNIVGPPYAVNQCVPALGPLTGNTEVELHGVGFYDTSQIDIRFSVGKQTVTVAGKYDDETKCITL